MTLERVADDQLELTVQDRGRGLPPEDDRRVSLGMRLMNGVARQLGGRLEMQDAQPGVRVVLTMPTDTDTHDDIEGGDHA